MVKVCVIGSCAMDLVVTSTKRPQAGETVLGDKFSIVPGGKGANQAIAAARLGAQVTMIGCVGTDFYGDTILENFKQNAVDISYIERSSEVDSGTAHIILAEGDNSIIVVKGANDNVTTALIDKSLEPIKTAHIVLIQQEIPEETVDYVSDICAKYKVPLLLNPAPARSISQKIIEQAQYLTPNEHECAILFPRINTSQALQLYPNKLFITEGSKGVRYFNGEQEVLVPTYKVNAVDTTGAGDTFNAALAVSLAEGNPIDSALKFANRAASLSVTKFGAQGGMPSRAEVEEKL
ncbi:ribokinase [Paenibacillus sp. FSL W7-1287]|uniref:ribokinase n=1 Tax=Paenibacillus sp. FSL W7-1287 TaxID=2954538 RepID=UPI0030F4D4D6